MFSNLVLCAVCDRDITAMTAPQQEEHYMTCDKVSLTGVVLVDIIANFVRHGHSSSLKDGGDRLGAYIPDLYRLTEQYNFEDEVVDDCIRGHLVASGNFYFTPGVEQHLKMCAIEPPPESDDDDDDDEDEEDAVDVEAFIRQADREARASLRAGTGTFSINRLPANRTQPEQPDDTSGHYHQMFTSLLNDPELRAAAAAQGFVAQRGADGSIAFVNPNL